MSEKVDIFMPVFVGDYLRDTIDLSLEENGAYSRLLFTMWSRGGRLLNDPARLARIAGCELADWQRLWPILARFFTIEGNDITQKRLTKELEKARAQKLSAAENGRRGADARWKSDLRDGSGMATPMANAMANGWQNDGSSPSPSESPPKQPAQSDPRAIPAAPTTEPEPGPVALAHAVAVAVEEAGEMAARAPLAVVKSPVPSAHDLLALFGRLRCECLETGRPWDTPGLQARGKAQDFVDRLRPEDGPLIEPSLRLFFTQAKAGKDPRLREVAFGFSAWLTRFPDLCEQLSRPKPKPRAVPQEPAEPTKPVEAWRMDQPCDFHEEPRNQGRRARWHSSSCPECRHVKARASPRAGTNEPATTGEIFGVMAQGREARP